MLTLVIEPGLLKLFEQVAGVQLFWDTVYVCSKVPQFIQWISPPTGILDMHEQSWNAHPYSRTIVTVRVRSATCGVMHYCYPASEQNAFLYLIEVSESSERSWSTPRAITRCTFTFFHISLPIIDRFLKFFHWHTLRTMWLFLLHHKCVSTLPCER